MSTNHPKRTPSIGTKRQILSTSLFTKGEASRSIPSSNNHSAACDIPADQRVPSAPIRDGHTRPDHNVDLSKVEHA